MFSSVLFGLSVPAVGVWCIGRCQMLFPVLGVTVLLRCSRAENHTESCVSLFRRASIVLPLEKFQDAAPAKAEGSF